jgi:ABC-2 type transport system permease protein
MSVLLRKWRAVFSIYFQDGLAYRASGLIWILTDCVTGLTMPLVWARSSSIGGGIGGYNLGGIVLYYLVMLMVGSFVTSHMMWEAAMEIKDGAFSAQLIRPIGYLQFMFLRNLSWRIIRFSLFLPFALLFMFAYRGYLHDIHLNLGWEFWASLLLGHLVSFFFVMMMAMLALFVQEAMAIFELYYIPMLFLSGQIFPVDVLPTWAAKVSRLLPFYYTTGAPSEIAVGRLTGPAIQQSLLFQAGYVVATYLVGRWLWKKGLPYYTGVGM